MRQHLYEVTQERLGYDLRKALLDLGPMRLQAMDDAGIDRQVLSFTSPGCHAFDPATATSLMHESNETLAEAVARHPDRFSAFATVSLAEPQEAPRELERCVAKHGFVGAMINGHYRGTFLDDRRFDPLFECAQALDVPIYLHPVVPLPTLLQEYLEGYDELKMPAWGFGVDTGIHFLRIVLSGVFDRFPRLRMVLGHLGENLPFGLQRLETHTALSCRRRGLSRTIREYVRDHLWVTTSGNFSTPALLCTMLELGVDRILFSVDWPYESSVEAATWLRRLPVSEPDRDKIAHANAAALLKL